MDLPTANKPAQEAAPIAAPFGTPEAAGPPDRLAAAPVGNRLYALLEILLCSGLVTTLVSQGVFILAGIHASTILGTPRLTVAFLVLESTLMLVLIAALLSIRSQRWGDLGLNWLNLKTEVRIGVAVVPLLFAANLLVSEFFRLFLPQWHSRKNPLLDMIQDPWDLLMFLLLALFAGGIKEEVQRAFILHRFRCYFSAAVTGLILWSVVFGAGHAVQGVDSAVGASLLGFLFGGLYLWRGSLTAPIVSHALYDVLVLIGYWFLGSG